METKVKETYLDCLKILDNLLEATWSRSNKRGIKIARDLIADRMYIRINQDKYPDLYNKPWRINKSLDLKEAIWKKYNGN